MENEGKRGAARESQAVFQTDEHLSILEPGPPAVTKL